MAVAVANKTEKLYAHVTPDFAEKAKVLSSELGLKISEMLREALVEYINKKEQEILEQEIIDACKYYYNEDKKLAAEWRYAEAEV